MTTAKRTPIRFKHLLGCPSDCTNVSDAACPRCFAETGTGCHHGPLCQECGVEGVEVAGRALRHAAHRYHTATGAFGQEAWLALEAAAIRYATAKVEAQP